MIRVIIAIMLFIITFTTRAQINVPQVSPKATVIQKVGLTDVEIEYSRPSVKDRIIFGGLVPFDKLWRAGANANTTISFSDDVIINNTSLPKGKYAIYIIPQIGQWEIIFYADTNNWGLPEKWDDSKIVLRTFAKTEALNRAIETYTIGVNNTDVNFANLEFYWEKTMATLKFEVPTQKNAITAIQKVLNGPTASDYFSAAQYYYQSSTDLQKALQYVNKAIENTDKKPYWYTRLKALIQDKLGDKKGALETAKQSLAAAQLANNAEYIKMNQDSINQWSVK